MTDTAAITVEGFVPITRVHKGELVESELYVEFFAHTRALAIGEGWSSKRQRLKKVDLYAIEPFDTTTGRAFRLVRSRQAVERDPDGVTHYCVLIAGGQSSCDCKGFFAAETRQMECKHLAAVRWLVNEGHL
jgi:hypothetical protein